MSFKEVIASSRKYLVHMYIYVYWNLAKSKSSVIIDMIDCFRSSWLCSCLRNKSINHYVFLHDACGGIFAGTSKSCLPSLLKKKISSQVFYYVTCKLWRFFSYIWKSILRNIITKHCGKYFGKNTYGRSPLPLILHQQVMKSSAMTFRPLMRGRVLTQQSRLRHCFHCLELV